MDTNIRTRWILAGCLAAGFLGAGAFFISAGAAPRG